MTCLLTCPSPSHAHLNESGEVCNVMQHLRLFCLSLPLCCKDAAGKIDDQMKRGKEEWRETGSDGGKIEEREVEGSREKWRENRERWREDRGERDGR